MSDSSQCRPFAVTVFCGSKPGNGAQFMQLARDVGQGIARRGWLLVYGGGKAGLMGAVADACLAAGGSVHGIITEKLVSREVAHMGLTKLDVVQTMAQRKESLLGLGDAFLSLPGGLGTLDEMFEVLTNAQLGLHNKPSAVLNYEGFYEGLKLTGAQMQNAGFLYPGVWGKVAFEATVDGALDRLSPLA